MNNLKWGICHHPFSHKMRLFDTTSRRTGNNLIELLVMQLPQGIPSPPPAGPPNAVTRSRREYHYACPFSSRIAHHRPCKRFPIHSEYHFRLLAPLCCSRTNVCSQIIGYLIFNASWNAITAENENIVCALTEGFAKLKTAGVVRLHLGGFSPRLFNVDELPKRTAVCCVM